MDLPALLLGVVLMLCAVTRCEAFTANHIRGVIQRGPSTTLWMGRKERRLQEFKKGRVEEEQRRPLLGQAKEPQDNRFDSVLGEEDKEDDGAEKDMAVPTGQRSLDDADMDVDAIFKKYGIDDKPKGFSTKPQNQKKTKANKMPGEGDAFGEDVISKIPMKDQSKIDDLLVGLTFTSLTAVVLCGIGISAGAAKLVFPGFVLNETVDNVVMNILTPSFTPALGIFFLFSITYGLFKFAQVSSEATVYNEGNKR